MPFREDGLIQLSALQHLAFCERQAALILLEQVWADNVLTVSGDLFHKRVDEQGAHFSEAGVRVEYALPVRSLRLGLAGRADAVEFRKAPDGRLLPSPVEYKRGAPKPDITDKVQLCAQALCLEEMLGVEIAAGALFYGQTRHREEVPFDKALRDSVETLAVRLHELLEKGETPPPPADQRRCRNCSLLEFCLPASAATKASDYVKRIFSDEEAS